MVDVFNSFEAKRNQSLSNFTSTLETGTGEEYDNWTATYISGSEPVDNLPKADTEFWPANREFLLIVVVIVVLSVIVLWDQYLNDGSSAVHDDIELDQELSATVDDVIGEDEDYQESFNEVVAKGLEQMADDGDQEGQE